MECLLPKKRPYSKKKGKERESISCKAFPVGTKKGPSGTLLTKRYEVFLVEKEILPSVTLLTKRYEVFLVEKEILPSVTLLTKRYEVSLVGHRKEYPLKEEGKYPFKR